MTARAYKDPLARTRRAPATFSWLSTLRAHLQANVTSLGRMYRTPFSTLMTICVIGIALALPTGFLVLLNNARQVYQGFDRGTQISLYLNAQTPQSEVDELLGDLRLRSDVGSVNYISPDDGLVEFTRNSGFADVIKHLPDNPLPPVIEVFPAKRLHSPEQIENLLVGLQHLPQVDVAKLDMQWVKRLRGIIDLGRHGTLALLLLFFVAVVLVIGNTIRLATHNQRSEIEVIKFIGGTDAFVRRPFLYTGMYYGLFGGITACLMIAAIVLWIAHPVSHLAELYDSEFRLSGLSLINVGKILLVSMSLGLVGAWIAVQRQLRDFDPV